MPNLRTTDSLNALPYLPQKERTTMQITPIQQNNNTFKALKMPKKVQLTNEFNEGVNIKMEDFLKNPAIKECADKYNVLVKQGKKIGNITLPEKVFPRALAISLGAGIVASFGIAPLIPSLAGALITTSAVAVGMAFLAYLNMPLWLDKIFGANKYEYTLQGGKMFKDNKMDEFAGAQTPQYRFKNKEELYNIYGLAENIRQQDEEKFSDILYRNNAGDFYETGKILKILELPEIKENFYNGEVFNYPADKDGNSLFLQFLDIVPNEKNQNDYNKILSIIKNMPNINLIQKDNFGISSAEKILNSENHQTLELLKGVEIPYSKELDYAYDQICDENFKRKAKTLNVRFDDIFKAIDLQSERGFEEAIKQFDSPFCNKQKIVAEIFQMAHELKMKFRYPKDERKYMFLNQFVYPRIEEYLPDYMKKKEV